MKQPYLSPLAGSSSPVADATTTHEQPGIAETLPFRKAEPANLFLTPQELAEVETLCPSAPASEKCAVAQALQQLKIASWKIDSVEFRDAVRAGNEFAVERLRDVVYLWLADLSEKVVGFEASLDEDLEDPILDVLLALIEDQAESDAQLKEEEDLEEIADLLEEAERTTQETPTALSSVRGTGHVEPSEGGTK